MSDLLSVVGERQAALYRQSLQIILANQAPSGAFVACPNFKSYQYCWFRDGAFIALALDGAGQAETSAASGRFHDWVVAIIERYAATARQGIAKSRAGQPLNRVEDVLHCRYTLDGQPSQEDWTPFQLDGFGTWLYALKEHLAGLPAAERQDKVQRYAPAIGLIVEYLAALWRTPNFDCWEEHGDKLATATLAALYGGLAVVKDLAAFLPTEGSLGQAAKMAGQTAIQIKDYVLKQGVRLDKAGQPYLTKFCGGAEAGELGGAVDANLLWVAYPYGLVGLDTSLMQNTLAKIITDLIATGRTDGSGGVHRYRRDTYYGGGEWLLLTGWLGVVLAEAGERQAAEALKSWIEAHSGPGGAMPEQVFDYLNQPAMLDHWLNLWGPVATPLLWSQATYLTLVQRLTKPDRARKG